MTSHRRCELAEFLRRLLGHGARPPARPVGKPWDPETKPHQPETKGAS